jgi:hypothetical protein
MNFEDIQKAWVSPDNQPSENETMKLKQELINRVRRRRRFNIIWLVQTSVMLVAATIIAIIALQSNRTSIVAEWSAILMLVVSWTCFLLIAWKRFHRKPAATMDQPIADAVRVALHDNRVARVVNTVCAWLLVLTVMVLPIVMFQLHAAGKASSRELLSMGIAFGGVLSLFGTWLAWNGIRRLGPEQRHLEALLDPDGP